MITIILLILDLYLNSLLIMCLPYLIHLFVRVATELIPWIINADTVPMNHPSHLTGQHPRS